MADLPPNTRLVIVTGLSGSGKSIAIRQLEDDGYYCLDNLPVDFLVSIVEHLCGRGYDRIAISIDARSQMSMTLIEKNVAQLRSQTVDVRTLFLTASNTELVKRFSETKRRHPLSVDRNGKAERTLSEAIRMERELLASVAEHAHVIDTSRVLPNTLRSWVREFAQAEASTMTLAFESFAFKHGTPVAADFVFDVRNLPNPFYDETLRPFTGIDAPIIAFLQEKPEVNDMLDDITRFIEKWLPSYEAQNRHYLTIAIGCTGGQHRSVYVAQKLAERFQGKALVVVRHRRLARPPL